MAKIQNVGIGNYIRNPRKIERDNGVARGEVMQVFSNEGNSFRCHPVKEIHSTRVVLDMEKYAFIPIDTEVEQVTI